LITEYALVLLVVLHQILVRLVSQTGKGVVVLNLDSSGWIHLTMYSGLEKLGAVKLMKLAVKVGYYRGLSGSMQSVKQCFGGNMAVLGLHHCSVIVKSTTRSLAFYSSILGLDVDNNRPDLGYPGAWLNVGQQQIHLLELENPDPIQNRPEHGGRDRHTALSVDNLDQIVTNLEKAAVEYTLSKSGRRALFCRDPDGNAVEIIEKI